MPGTLRLPKKTDKARGFFHAMKGKAQSTAHNKTRNFTSKPGEKVGGDRAGEPFGKPEPYTDETRPDRKHSFTVGAITGLTGGGVGAGAIHSNQTNRDRRVAYKFEREKTIAKARVPKETVHLITDLGTASAKRANRRWPKLSKPALAGGLAGGAGLEYALASGSRKQARQELDTKYKSKANQATLKRIRKRDVALERYTPNRKERAKIRGEDAGKGALVGAVGWPTARYAGREIMHRAQTPPEYKEHRLPRKKIPMKKLGKQTAIAAGVVGAYDALGHRSKTQYRVVNKRNMSDAEIRRRKKLQGHISVTTGTLGLASVGAFGASKVPGAKFVAKTPRLARAASRINPKKAENAALGLSTTAGGIGGAGSFNFASYTAAEGKKKRAAVPVQKSQSMDMGFYGEEGTAITHEEIEEEIAKAWEPVASTFDSESSRAKRNKYTEIGATGAAAGLGGLAARRGHQAVVLRGQSVQREKKGHSGLKARKLAGVRGRKAAVLGTAAVAAGTTAGVFHHGRKAEAWQPYAKRDTTSAFGIDHE